MRNEIRRKHFGDRQKFTLRFTLAIQEPEHRAQILVRGPELGIEADGLAIEFLSLLQILQLCIRDPDLLADIGVGWLRAMQIQQKLEGIPGFALLQKGLRPGEGVLAEYRAA